MKTGDLIIFHFSTPAGVGMERKKSIGILISSKGTKWDPRVQFHTILSIQGLMEVIKFDHDDSWKVLSETG
jgi:hypothetical protein